MSDDMTSNVMGFVHPSVSLSIRPNWRDRLTSVLCKAVLWFLYFVSCCGIVCDHRKSRLQYFTYFDTISILTIYAMDVSRYFRCANYVFQSQPSFPLTLEQGFASRAPRELKRCLFPNEFVWA